MHVREGLNASLDRRFEIIWGIALRQTHGGLHQRQEVLGTVVNLAREESNMLFLLLSLGDVTSDLRCTDYPAIATLHRRNRQRNRNQASILAPANRFVVFDALAAPDALDDRALFILAIRRNENGNGLAYDFFGHVAEESCR